MSLQGAQRRPRLIVQLHSMHFFVSALARRPSLQSVVSEFVKFIDRSILNFDWGITPLIEAVMIAINTAHETYFSIAPYETKSPGRSMSSRPTRPAPLRSKNHKVPLLPIFGEFSAFRSSNRAYWAHIPKINDSAVILVGLVSWREAR